MEAIMLFAAIVTAIATVAIAGATIVYVIVTKKLWQATLDTAKRTEELAQRSWDTLKLQVVIYLLDLRERKVTERQLSREFGVPPEQYIASLTGPLLAALAEESQRAEFRFLIYRVFDLELE